MSRFPDHRPSGASFPGRFGLILLVMGLLGLAVLAFAGYSGYHLDPLLRERQKHLLLGVAATLPLLFANAWVAIYLLAMGRRVGPLARGLATPMLSEEVQSYRRRSRGAILAAVAAISTLLVTFLLGPAVLLGHTPWWSHGAAFWLCGTVQLVALVLAWRALIADRQLRHALAATEG